MDISIVIPYFQGGRYLLGLLKNIEQAVVKLDDKFKVELIIVNDSPWDKIEYFDQYTFETKIITNEYNSGIHKSRVNGLNIAKGKYILFLDQDDEITEVSLLSQIKKITTADIIIGNGFFKLNRNDSYKIYKNANSQKQIKKEWPYLFVKNLIVSPGQALIKRKSIPNVWKENIVKHNGADDYLLWLLMLDRGMKFELNSDYVYVHNDSGENISFDIEKMNKSLDDLIVVLKKAMYPIRKLDKLKKTIGYKHKFMTNKKEFVLNSFFNMDILLVSVYFRIVYGRTVTSNRVFKKFINKNTEV